MAAVSLTPSDLAPFTADNPIPAEKAAVMIEDALAQAWLVAPCLVADDLDDRKAAAAKSIIRGAILRWHDSGTGAVTSQQALGFQQTLDTRQPRRSLFWPSEIEQLEKLCRTETGGGAWSYDTAPMGDVHADVCALNLGANYCSCGAILAGFPLWETAGD